MAVGVSKIIKYHIICTSNLFRSDCNPLRTLLVSMIYTGRWKGKALTRCMRTHTLSLSPHSQWEYIHTLIFSFPILLSFAHIHIQKCQLGLFALFGFDTFHKHRGKLFQRTIQVIAGLRTKKAFHQKLSVIAKCQSQVYIFVSFWNPGYPWINVYKLESYM